MKRIAILGMAFKAESDDARDSLSYKLKKIASVISSKPVLCHDFFVEDPSLTELTETIKNSDVLILATPHQGYKAIDPKKYGSKKFIDIWNFWKTNI